MTEYETQRAQHVARWGELLSDRMARLRWSREQIADEQRRALRSLLTIALQRSPWHAGRLRGIDVASLEPDDLPSLPTMTKADLMASFDDIVTDRRVTLAAAEAHLARLDGDAYFCDDLHVVASGGSSGEHGVFVYGWDAWVEVHLGLSRRIVDDVLGGVFGDGPVRIGVVAAANATHMTAAVAATFASPMVATTSLPVALPLPSIVAGLNECRPDLVITYASMLGVLAGEAAGGRLRIAPRRIVATSEPLLPEVRAAAEDAFGAPVVNCWGTSEAAIVAVGCSQSHGMHLNEDLVIVEPVDATGRPVPAGQRADKVLVTNLFNTTLPLLRYELTDEVVLLDEPCPCGSAHRRVADVAGRLDDLFSFGDITIHPHVLRSVLGKVPAVVEYQVRQRGRGCEVDVVAPRLTGDELERLREGLAAGLRRAGLHDPEVVVRPVASLARHAETGKLRRFVPLVPV